MRSREVTQLGRIKPALSSRYFTQDFLQNPKIFKLENTFQVISSRLDEPREWNGLAYRHVREVLDPAGPGLQPPHGCLGPWCPGKEASVSAQSLPSLLGKERSPEACGDLTASPARHRPGARRSHCCRWPLQSLLLSVIPVSGPLPGGRSSTSSCLDLSSLQLPWMPREGDSESGCSCCWDAAPHSDSALGRGC